MVYENLRRLARKRMTQERPGHTLQATALVHEAVLRLLGQDTLRRWVDRWHFFAAAAESMRRILVDAARGRKRLKRAGGIRRVSLDELTIAVEGTDEELVALDEALTQLAVRHPDKAELVKLRYFGGLTLQEAAGALNISGTTADRHWAFARAWLYRHIRLGEQALPREREEHRLRQTPQE